VTELDDLLTQILGKEFDSAGQTVDEPAWARLNDAGLTRVGIPETLGGAGGNLSDAATVTTRCAQAGIDVPLTESLFLAAYLATTTGCSMPRGMMTVAIVEPHEQPWRRTTDGWHIDVSLAAVPWAGQWDHLWALGRTDHGDAALLQVDASGLRGTQNTGSVAGASLPPRFHRHFRADRVVEIDPVIVDEVKLAGALGRSCQLLGALRASLNLSCRYTAIRTQFRRTLASHQVVQHALAVMADDVAACETAMRTAVDHASALASPISVEAAMAIAAAKIQTSLAATRVARSAHQLHGAIGLTAEYPLHHYTTRLWRWRDDYGSEYDWSIRVAEIVRTAYQGDIWQALTAQSITQQSHSQQIGTR
jgi:acyl-CoA dehydrogenase